MKKILLLAAISAATASCISCQESLEERAAREAREFTEKNCPVRISEAIVSDSLTFEPSTKTLHYYMSVNGNADTTAIAQQTDIRKNMISSLKGTTSVRPYKEAGYNFKYTYRSTKHPGKILLELTITKADYNN